VRICSLLPSSTEIVYALGLGEELVAVTHECDYPPEAASKPQITESLIDHERLSSMEIDHRVSGAAGHHGSIYRLKPGLLEALNPDVILTQELCEVCAVSYSEVKRAARLLDGSTQILSLEPNTLEEVIESIGAVGEITHRRDEAETVKARLRRRLEEIRQRVMSAEPRPRVYAMEWLDPAYSPGHWVPEMIEIAGGRPVLGRAGAKSARISAQDIIEAEPEVIVLMPCGFSLPRTIEEFHRTPMFAGWERLPAVRNGRLYAVDGSSYFNRPGPRLVDGVSILAEILHPQLCNGWAPAVSFQKIS
jgi:iron complex transport system substrate-binding protein